MTFNEKRQLVRLLNKYQDEQIGLIEESKENIKIAELSGKQDWEADVKFGCKAQYEHARIISTKLSKQINDELPSYWNY